ncbi:MAG: histidine phosphatase family protein [Pseudonocardiaceae bacterium]
MRSIHVIAHSEATHHVEGVVGGWHDSDLTPAGARAAEAIARALRSVIPDGAEVELFSSDLRRARRTADAMAEKFGVTPMLDRRLGEKSYGDAEGRPRDWLDQWFMPPPATGWDTTKACPAWRPRRRSPSASTPPWTMSYGARASTRSL